MRKSIIEKVEQIKESFFVDINYFKYQHSVSINGWLLIKPITETLKTNDKEVARFYLYQIHRDRVLSYPCQTFSKPIIEQLKNVECVSLINCLGRITYYNKGQITVQIEEISITHEFSDIKLDDPYKKGEIICT